MPTPSAATPPADEQRIRRLEGLLGLPMQPGHTITRLRNGVEIFPAMVEAMRAAQRSIDLLTFVYWTGEPARMIGETLEERARAGVRVRVILDAFGARDIDRELVERLEDAGVAVHWFRPPEASQEAVKGIGKRTHRKVCVVDETIAFTGGVGIAQEWAGDARDADEWRDTHFRVTGPCVDTLRVGFLDDWIFSGHPMATEHDEFPPHDTSGPVRALVVLGESEVNLSATWHLKHVLLEGAMDRIRLTTAYFSPNDEMAAWLADAAQRGVDVQVMFPGGEIDKRLPQANGERRYPELLEAGVTLLAYEPTMLHAKVLTIDGCIADIGSSNFNDRSVRHDEEIDLVAYDRDLVAVLDEDFERDRTRCIVVDEDWWEDRTLLDRAQAAASALIDGFI